MKKKKKTEEIPITEAQYKVMMRDFLIINSVVGIACLGLFIVMILQKLELFPSLPCIFHDVVRMYCPGCGGTRALFELLQGNFIESLRCNPIVLLGIILVTYYEIGITVTLLKKNGRYYFYRKGTFVYLYIIILLVFAIMRNYFLLVFRIDYLGDFVR